MENKKTEVKLKNASYHPKLRWKIDVKKCTLCSECIDACSLGLLVIKNNLVNIEQEGRCTQCGDCAAACGYYAIVLT